MKPAGLLLLLPAGFIPVDLLAESPPSLVSREIAAHIREGLPAFQPPPPKPANPTTESEAPQPTDPNILVLPKMTVKESRLPSDAADHLMRPKDFKRKMENLYLDEIAKDGALNYLLNCFTIPILSPSKADRGRAIYQHRELDRLRHVTDAARSIDPDATKTMERELDNSHTTRPAGGLPKR